MKTKMHIRDVYKHVGVQAFKPYFICESQEYLTKKVRLVNAIIFRSNSNISIFHKKTFSDIVCESEILNYMKPLIDDIKNNCNADFKSYVIDFDSLKLKISKEWKYYKDLEKTINRFPIIVTSFDFKHPNKVIDFLEKNDVICDDETINKKVIDSFSETNGLSLLIGPCFYIFLDKNHKQNNTLIEHELYHYFQHIVLNSSNFNDEKTVIKDVKEFQASKETIEYLLSEKEFYAHLSIDLVNNMLKCYLKFYKDKDVNWFLQKYLTEVKNDPLNILKSDIGINFIKITTDISSFIILPLCKIFKLSDLYDNGEKTFVKHFKQSFKIYSYNEEFSDSFKKD